ncbi:DUF2235 domain-containing protein [Stenotrophomonas tumulicola]|uniref:DUF2235 domain-containing protein n=2 Tax=Stenotrophomonas tumulicola TaxID=1685415 RepID=A0A7W3FMN7_9GAMM|nr:DUF2235 domain-containing protein [Stenotrophomonas tumulicola]
MPATDRRPSPTQPPGMLQIGLFFDGTRNNMHNLAHGGGRPQPTSLPTSVQADDASPYLSRITSSFDNGLTNIARLHACYADSRRDASGPLSLAIYIEGAGTRDGLPDDLLGLAFGTGTTGVRAKVRRALQELLPAALRALASVPSPALAGVRIDLFGFSRGAASARDAAHRLTAWTSAQWMGVLREAGLSISPRFELRQPTIRFIGLFDTVAAVSSRRSDEQPQLRLPVGIAGKVLQLAARDEHREHFALASVAPEHEQVLLPGVHANIGGGYDQAEEGPKLLTRPRSQRVARPPFADFAAPDRAWLHATPSHLRAEAEAEQWRQRLGLDASSIWVDSWHQWLRQRQSGSTSVLPSPTLYVYSAVVLKRPIDWRYQLVALRLMHQRTLESGVAWALSPDDMAGWALPDELQPIARELLQGHTLDAAAEQLLRQRYIMQSAHWNFDALGDTALTYAADAGVSELPYRPGPGLFYINRPTDDGQRVVLHNA